VTSGAQLKTLAAGHTVSLAGDTLWLQTGIKIDAGSTGTVQIQPTSTGNAIALNYVDIGGAKPSQRLLGLDQGELNSISAGQLVLGGNTTGAINLRGAISTNANIGQLQLTSADTVTVDQTLNVAGDLGIRADKITVSKAIQSPGRVTLANFSSGTRVHLGGADVAASAGIAATLGVDQAELDLISAAQLTVGSSTAGDLRTSAVNTKTSTGQLQLLTGGNIAINGLLTVGGAASRQDLVLNAQGSNSTVQQSGAMVARGLALLGDHARHTLNHSANTVTTLAAATQSVEYTSTQALTVGRVAHPLDAIGAATGAAPIATTGITAHNVNLTGKAHNGGIGLLVGENINASGPVSITGSSSSGVGVRIDANKGIYTTNSADQPTTVQILGTGAGPSGAGVEVLGTVSTRNASSLRIEGRGIEGSVGIYSQPTQANTNIGNLGSSTSGDISLLGSSTGGVMQSPTNMENSNGIFLRGSIRSQQKIRIVGSSDSNAGVFLLQSRFNYGGEMTGLQPSIQVHAGGAAIAGDAIFIQDNSAPTLSQEASQASNSVHGVWIGTNLINNSTGGATRVLSDQGGITLLNTTVTKTTGAQVTTTSAVGSISNGAQAGAIVLSANNLDNGSIGKTPNDFATTYAGSTSQIHFSTQNTTITQNSNAGIQLSTAGQGNLHLPTLNNLGTGTVTVAAGAQLAAGVAGGGQIKTAIGNTINNPGGATRIYTGSVADTGKLSDSIASLSTLYLSNTNGHALNAHSKVAYTDNASTLATAAAAANGNNVQVMFRETIDLGNIALLSDPKGMQTTYGSVDKTNATATLNSAVRSHIKANNANTAGASNAITVPATGAANQLQISAIDLIDSMAIVPNTAFTATDFSTSDHLKANATGYGYNATFSSTRYRATVANLQTQVVVNPRTIGMHYTADDKKANGSTLATVQSHASNLLPNDQVSLTQADAHFDNANPGPNKQVTITNISLAGSDASNYALPSTTAQTTANILSIKPTPEIPITPIKPTPEIPITPTVTAAAALPKLPIATLQTIADVQPTRVQYTPYESEEIKLAARPSCKDSAEFNFVKICKTS
jgi:hypothetical protein